MREDLVKGLTKEQIARVRACKTQEELLKLAKEEGVQLNDEQLEAVNGGGCNSATKPTHCPRCNSTNIRYESCKHEMSFSDYYYKCKCKDCYYKWEVE